MRKAIILSFLCLCLGIQTHAQRISCRFNNVSMAEALRTINNMQKDYTVNFIYDDLEDFRVTTTIKNKHTPEAIQQLIGFYPIKQTSDGHSIFVECTHKTTHHMSGRIIDEQGNPIEFANIGLLSVKDSTLIGGGVSNASGVFVIPSDAEENIVRVSHVGYTTYFRHAETGDIGTIRLIQTSVNLKNVTIKAENIHNTSTGYTFIMAGSGLENSTSINSAFAMLPGISITEEKISLFGNLPVIYVDGFKITSQEELKGLSPDRIKKIDVQYLSTGESAFTKGGVIYITTRKALQGGYTGYLGITVNESANYGHVKDSPYFTLNASMGKWSSNLWIRHNHQKLYEDAEYETHFSDNSQTKEYGETRSWYNSLAGRLNLTRELTNKSYIAVSQYISFANVKDSYIGHQTSWENNVMTFDEEYHITGPDKTNTSQSVLKYHTETDDKGSSFSITGDYLHQWDRIRETHTLIDNKIISDTEDNISTDMVKVSPRYTRNIQNDAELKLGGDWQFIQAKDETCGIISRMKGNMASVFGNYSTRINKIMLSAGLTMQYNWTDIEVQDAVNDYDKLYVCPQANLMWMLSPKRGTRLMIMYQHSVDEIPYSLITSARTYTSTTHYTTGNPNLKTPSTHQIMTQFAVNKNLSFTAIAARGLNSIFFINEQDKDDARITGSKPVNAYHIQLWGLGGEYLAKPFKWWDTKIQARAQNIMTSSEIINNNGNICGLFWWNNNFNFTPTFGGGLHAYWETSSKFDDRTMKPVGSLNMSLWKTLMNNRLYISVDANLWSKGRQYTVTADGFQRYYHNATKTHWAGVTVRWNFKGGKSYHSREEAESLQRYNKIEEKK